VLVSGRSARVASRGIEREGLPVALVEQLQRDYKADPKNKGKSVPNRVYREGRTRPLLLIHVLRETNPQKTFPAELVALGLSFPEFDDTDVARRVKYRVNLVAWRALADNEIDDELERSAMTTQVEAVWGELLSCSRRAVVVSGTLLDL